MEEVEARLKLALAAAERCAELTLPLFRSGVKAEMKEDGSPVTVADRNCEELIAGLIGREFPEDAITGEEFGVRGGRSGYRWYLDPIDGTKSFVAGVPLWGTLIGIEREGEVVAGVASLPAVSELLYASAGGGAWHVHGWQTPSQPRRPAKVSTADRLAEALFCYTSAAAFWRRGAGEGFGRLARACRTVRGWGDCYGWLLVATGRAELMIDTHVKPWDVAPFAVILREAGGTMTDWKGEATIHGGEAIASNGRVLAEALALLG